MLDARKVKAEKPRNIKRRNQKAIVALLQNNTEMTIPEIAERLELSRTSATQIVNELCKRWAPGTRRPPEESPPEFFP